MDKNSSKYIYVMISCTPTRIAYMIRKFGHARYNHAAIALDSDLNELYAFARRQHNAPILGGLVSESVSRYTLGRTDTVNVVIFRLPVTAEQYAWVRSTIRRISSDPEYIYNLLSVLTFPVTGGFETYKAFSCVEFVCYILEHLGYCRDVDGCHCRPDDLLTALYPYMYYEGNLLDYKPDTHQFGNYFAPFNRRIVRQSAGRIVESFSRLRRPVEH